MFHLHFFNHIQGGIRMAAVISFTPHITEKGLMGLWESGGFEQMEGYSQIIAGTTGEPLQPVYVKTRAKFNDDKALFVVNKGYHLVIANYMNKDFSIQVYVIRNIDVDNARIEAEEIASLDDGAWSNLAFEESDMVKAARERAKCRRCDQVFYAKHGEE